MEEKTNNQQENITSNHGNTILSWVSFAKGEMTPSHSLNAAHPVLTFSAQMKDGKIAPEVIIRIQGKII